MLRRLLNVEPGEGAALAALSASALAVAAAGQLGEGVSQTLFLKRVGPEYVPHMVVLKAALDAAVALLYVPLAARVEQRRLMLLYLLAAALGTLALWGAAAAEVPAAYPALYAWSESLGTLLKIHWGVVLLEQLRAEAAGRTFPIIYGAARAGAAAGGALLGPLSAPLGAAHLLPISAGLYLAGALALRAAPPPGGCADPERERVSGALIRAGLGAALRSPLLRAIALSTALMVICRFCLRYAYSRSFAGELGEEAALASFLGRYLVLANLGGLLVQLTLTSRLLATVGITLTNLVYALASCLGFLWLYLRPGLGAAVGARLVENELKASIKTPISNLFYGALPSAERPPARAATFGLVIPVATLAVGLVLLPGGAPVAWLPLWGGIAAVLFVGATLLQNRRYSQALAASRR